MKLLYITEFLTGMSVMAAELGAARFLAPYFSSSQIVWTIIIGMIMIAMSIGNIIGGRMADKNSDPRKLYMFIGIAGVWLALIPIFGKYAVALASLISAALFKENFLIWASFLSCLILFVFPLTLLGMTTPSLVKFAVNDLKDTGKITGRLEALQTIGSIIGTFIPTFFTIPSFGTKLTFTIFGFILCLISAVYFAGRRKFPVISLIIVIISGFISSNISYGFTKGSTVLEDESIYNYLRVEDTEDKAILSTHIFFGVQSIWKKNAEFTGMYYDVAFAAPFMADNFKSALILGNGTGTYAKLLKEHFPDSTITGVEIDKKIVDISKKYFDLPEDIEVLVKDGRAALKDLKTYDVIMVDTYRDITIPFELSTIEFFNEVKSHLNAGGVLVINMNIRGEINEYLIDTVSICFKNIYIAKSDGNIELFATDNEKAISNFNRAKRERDFLNDIHLEIPENGTKILTDDKAPVEVLGIKALDDIVKEELQSYGDIDFFNLDTK